MTTIWVLRICIGVSWAGCGSSGIYEYPSEASCYRALKEIRVEGQPVAESDARRSSVALCYPKFAPEEKK